MLSAVLHSDKAINVSIKIMNAFVEMRHFIYNNAQVFERLTAVVWKVANNKMYDIMQIKSKGEKMELYSTYIETDKFDDVVDFYEKVFEKKGRIYTSNRWVEFDFGNKLSIYNKLYDKEKIKSGNLQDNFNSEYIKNFNIDRGEKKNNIITLNFYAENLKEEYKRIKELNICKMSEIMYVNITEPYYYFNIFDPEGNTIEICSNSL